MQDKLWATARCCSMMPTIWLKRRVQRYLNDVVPTFMNITFYFYFFKGDDVVSEGSRKVLLIFVRRLQHIIFVRLAQVSHNMWCYKVKWAQFVWRSALPRTLCRCCLTLCILQGASEDAPPKKEKVDKGNENYQKVKEVRPFSQAFSFVGWFHLLDLLHQTPVNQSIWVGHTFYFILLLFIFGGGGASCGAVVYGFTSGGFYCSE